MYLSPIMVCRQCAVVRKSLLDVAHVKFCHCCGVTAEMLTAARDRAVMLSGERQLPCALTTLMESPGRS